jgi:predicted dehydrogenase
MAETEAPRVVERVKVGVIGLGSLAQRGTLPHTFERDARQRIVPVAVCDPVPGRADAVAERWLWEHAYTSDEEMLASADLDAVIINSPIPFHYAQIKRALEAGKHVYTQKSMTTTYAEADEVVELARSKGLTLVASPGEMLRPPWPQIKAQVVDAGLIGRVYWAIGGLQFPGHEHEQFRREDDVLANVDPAWYYKKGGGPLYDATVYTMHQMTGILGPVRRVSALSAIGLKERTFKGKTIEVEMDDNTQMLLDFGDGRHGVAYGAFCHGSSMPRFAIHGSEGTVEVTPVRSGPAPAQRGSSVVVKGWNVPGGEQALEVPEMPYRVGRHLEIGEAHGYADVMHFVECIQTGREPIPSGQHARHVIEIFEKAYQSAREGRSIEIESTL